LEPKNAVSADTTPPILGATSASAFSAFSDFQPLFSPVAGCRFFQPTFLGVPIFSTKRPENLSFHFWTFFWPVSPYYGAHFGCQIMGAYQLQLFPLFGLSTTFASRD
jgi:hypothetical protein